jgi:adenosine deaminase
VLGGHACRDVALTAGREAEARSGVIVRWMSPASRTRAHSLAMAQARMAASLAAAGEPIVSFGLHGSEGRKLSGEGPFPPEPFAEAFAVAGAAGLLCTPHAGEHLGAASCVGAVTALGAGRLQHGVRAVSVGTAVMSLSVTVPSVPAPSFSVACVGL